MQKFYKKKLTKYLKGISVNPESKFSKLFKSRRNMKDMNTVKTKSKQSQNGQTLDLFWPQQSCHVFLYTNMASEKLKLTRRADQVVQDS